MLKILSPLILLLVCKTSLALTPIEQHTLAVSQSMAAFYMYLLSQEDKKYLAQFDNYALQATEALSVSTEYDEQGLKQRWERLRPMLYFTHVKGMGATIDQKIRFDFRAYLVDLYLYLEKQKTPQTFQSKSERLQLDIAILVARALDVDSSIYGVNSFTAHDYQLDQQFIINRVEDNLEHMMNGNLDKPSLLDLRRIKAKLKFIRSSIADYKSSSAIYLTYQNASMINEMLELQRQRFELANR